MPESSTYQYMFCTDDIPPDGKARIAAISSCIEDYFEKHDQFTSDDSLLIKCLPLITNTLRHAMHPDQVYRMNTPHLLASCCCLNWYLKHEHWGNDIFDMDEESMVRKISQELVFLATQRTIDESK